MRFGKRRPVVCGYCGWIHDRDPFHVHGCNECHCGAKPAHNLYFHDYDGWRRLGWAGFILLCLAGLAGFVLRVLEVLPYLLSGNY